jgi:hypothetical protein
MSYEKIEPIDTTEDETTDQKTVQTTEKKTEEPVNDDKKEDNHFSVIFFITAAISLTSFILGIYNIANKEQDLAIISFVVFGLTFIFILLSLYLTFGLDVSKTVEKLQGPFSKQVTDLYYSSVDFINSRKPISSLQGGNNPSSNLFPMPIAFFKVYTFYWLVAILIFCLYLTSYYMGQKDHNAATALLVTSMIIIGYIYVSTMYDGSLEALKARKLLRGKSGKVDLSKGSKSTAISKLVKFVVGRPDPAELLEPRNLQPFIYYTIIFIIGIGIFYNYTMNKEKEMALFGFIIACIGAVLMYLCILANKYE